MSYDSIIILGPTATGKTGLSIELAQKLNAEIINADSMYIYKEFNIGTAKPTQEEMKGVVHHLIDIVEPLATFNVSNYRELASAQIEECKERKILPIIVGGTGFYIDSLISNFSYGETPKNQELRTKLDAMLQNSGAEALHTYLASLDPVSADRLHTNDTRRVIRAIEIALDSQTIKSNLSNDKGVILKNPLIIGLNMDRELLYTKINKRVDAMLNLGLLNEIDYLLEKGYTIDNCQAMKGIGYKELLDYKSGLYSFEEAIEKIKQHSRNYAKRQITWFKRNKNIIWLDASLGIKENLVKVLNMFYNDKTK